MPVYKSRDLYVYLSVDMQLMANTITDEEARKRLDAILSDRLLRFNPYRVADRDLLDCAERGRWSLFPSVTQMIVFHFHDIRRVPQAAGGKAWYYEAIFFHIGDLCEEHYFSLQSITRPMTNIITRRPEWTLVNGRHIVPSNIRKLVGKSVFVSHALNCERLQGGFRQAYRMHLLHGSEAKRADIVRRAMCEAKQTMLQEVLNYPCHPDYLGKLIDSFDYETPIKFALETIRNYPSAAPPAPHP